MLWIQNPLNTLFFDVFFGSLGGPGMALENYLASKWPVIVGRFQ